MLNGGKAPVSLADVAFRALAQVSDKSAAVALEFVQKALDVFGIQLSPDKALQSVTQEVPKKFPGSSRFAGSAKEVLGSQKTDRAALAAQLVDQMNKKWNEFHKLYEIILL